MIFTSESLAVALGLGVMDAETESYLLLLLSDGNLPTGSFVASSGLESHITHALGSSRDAMGSTLAFVRDSIGTYARSALPFARDAQQTILTYSTVSSSENDEQTTRVLDMLVRLDALYEATTLNHVTRRASCSQGVALLTLYTKGFSCPNSLFSEKPDAQRERESRLGNLVSRLKLLVRSEQTHGHLPICWGVLAGALGLSIERGTHLHLFLHARGILSAAIRMNALGPYAAQQLLLHAVRPLVDAEAKRSEGRTTGLWRDEREDVNVLEESAIGPATTWPLGEILAARHDQLHSRIFNS
ncbi:hypothetical protein EW146_g1343 [Bondarzewia mesenterica]|uniref:Urease accessory protein UreF n=1 Tax=Bondarzewia mesenterica TaxID=1095465 RepID=A0A4S4M5Z1_9AGAM|nr:hypothetical protein EW146_g1343 [Bondarzewia mesenterica]